MTLRECWYVIEAPARGNMNPWARVITWARWWYYCAAVCLVCLN